MNNLHWKTKSAKQSVSLIYSTSGSRIQYLDHIMN